MVKSSHKFPSKSDKSLLRLIKANENLDTRSKLIKLSLVMKEQDELRTAIASVKAAMSQHADSNAHSPLLPQVQHIISSNCKTIAAGRDVIKGYDITAQQIVVDDNQI